jgi:hypothetical protein
MEQKCLQVEKGGKNKNKTQDKNNMERKYPV